MTAGTSDIRTGSPRESSAWIEKTRRQLQRHNKWQKVRYREFSTYSTVAAAGLSNDVIMFDVGMTVVVCKSGLNFIT
jgi:hypothetical protein